MSFREIFPYLVIGVLMFMVLTKPQPTVKTIETPAKENNYVRENPQPIIKWDTIYRDSIRERVVVKENPVNQELLKKYQEAKDSLIQLQMYREAVTTRTYEEIYEDDIQTIKVVTEVTGTMERQELSYKVQPTQTEYKNPSEGLYLGLGLQVNNTVLQLPQPELNMSWLKDKEMYTLGVGTGTVRINYKRKIF